MNNKDKLMKLGEGTRDVATPTSYLKVAAVKMNIPKVLQLINEDDGRCVWLFVCVLINMTDNSEVAFLANLSKSIEKIEIIEFLHVTKTKYAGDCKTCQQLLESNTKYRLRASYSIMVVV